MGWGYLDKVHSTLQAEGDHWAWRRWPWNQLDFGQLKPEKKTFSKEKMAWVKWWKWQDTWAFRKQQKPTWTQTLPVSGTQWLISLQFASGLDLWESLPSATFQGKASAWLSSFSFWCRYHTLHFFFKAWVNFLLPLTPLENKFLFWAHTFLASTPWYRPVWNHHSLNWVRLCSLFTS